MTSQYTLPDDVITLIDEYSERDAALYEGNKHPTTEELIALRMEYHRLIVLPHYDDLFANLYSAVLAKPERMQIRSFLDMLFKQLRDDTQKDLRLAEILFLDDDMADPEFKDVVLTEIGKLNFYGSEHQYPMAIITNGFDPERIKKA